MLEQIAAVLGASIRERIWQVGSKRILFSASSSLSLGSAKLARPLRSSNPRSPRNCSARFVRNQLNSFQMSFYAFPDGWNGNGHKKTVDAERDIRIFLKSRRKKKLSLLHQARDGCSGFYRRAG